MIKDNKEEIGLKELIDETFNSKLVIFFSSILISLLCIVYYNLQDESWRGEIEINELNVIELNNYSNIFSTINKMKNLEFSNGTNNSSTNNKNTEINLLELLRSEISDKEEIVFFLRNAIFPNNDNLSIEDENYLKTLSKNFKIKSIEEDGSLNSLKLSFINQNFFIVNEIFNSVLLEANNNVKDELGKIINFSIDDYVRFENKQIDVIKMQIKNIEKRLSNEKKNRIEFLQNQATIARSLNIEESTAQSISFETSRQDTITAIAASSIKDQYYLRGFKAIEKELELFTKNNSVVDASDNETYFALNDKLEEIKITNPINDLTYYFERSPAYTGINFKSADFDLINLEISDERIDLKTILFIIVIISFLWSFLFVIFRLVYKKLYK